jgi:hypothetical protein
MNDSISSSEDPAAGVRERFEHSLVTAFFIAFIGFTTIGAVAGINHVVTAVRAFFDGDQPRREPEMIKNPKKDIEQHLKPRPAVASTALERPLPVFNDDHAGIPDEVAQPTADDVHEISKSLRISRLQGGGDWER